MLDEGERLMELGFEETIGSILGILEKKSKLPRKKGRKQWSGRAKRGYRGGGCRCFVRQP